MGEICGVAFTDVGGHNSAERAHKLACVAAHLGIPADVVDFSGPLRDLARTGGRGLTGRTLGRAVVEQAANTDQGQRILHAILIDEFRWRAWAAHDMGAALVICPDAPPGSIDSMSAMGLSVVRAADKVPGVAALAYGPGPAHDLKAGFRIPAAALPPDDPVLEFADDGRSSWLDDQVRLRALRARAGEVIVGGFQAGAREVGVVVADTSGGMWFGLGPSAIDGAGSLCAEAVAVANAAMGGADDLAYVAAVRHPRARPRRPGYTLLPPCPSCRALLVEAGEPVRAVVEGAAGLETMLLNSGS